MKFLFSFFFIFGIFSCTIPIDNNSKGFNKILKKLGTSIPIEPHIYFLIPQVSCHGCVQKNLVCIDKFLKMQDSLYVTFISGILSFDLEKFNTRSRIYLDSNNYLNELPFNIANLSIIETNNSVIIRFISLNPDNEDLYLNQNLFESFRKNFLHKGNR